MLQINKEKFKIIFQSYKENFSKYFPDEKYKWIAVKHFQDNWNIDARDFKEMLSTAMYKTDNLLAAANYFPLGMLERFCETDAEEVRSMFRRLYDESNNLFDRVERFIRDSERILKLRQAKGEARNESMHYQNPNSISTYLWLRYPDKYYLYKYSEVKGAMKSTDCSVYIKSGLRRETVSNSLEFFDDITSMIKEDNGFLRFYRDALTPDCYQDENMHLAAMDFVFFVNRYYPDIKKSEDTTDTVKEDVCISDYSDRSDSAASGSKNTDAGSYSEQDFLNEVFMSEEDLHSLLYLLENKKNIILQGAPGVGKTFSAKRLAYTMMGCKDDRRICMVQFHQNYSYEDFVIGYKPVEDGFKLKEGVFYNFCLQAENDPKNNYFFIIDEINRGNLSKIFGELLMAIESGYRGTKIRLAYGDKEFSVPENLCIIGMMNTADRSLAMIDYALRRRFSFFSLTPGFDTAGFRALSSKIGNNKFDRLVDVVKQLNADITHDASLGAGFQIGHSYFCKDGSVDDTWLETLVKYDIVPMLEEYWFDDREKFNEWNNRLLEAIR